MSWWQRTITQKWQMPQSIGKHAVYMLTVRCILFSVHRMFSLCKSLHRANSKSMRVGVLCVLVFFPRFCSFYLLLCRYSVVTTWWWAKLMLANAYNWLNWQQRQQIFLSCHLSFYALCVVQTISKMPEIVIVLFDRNIDFASIIMN